MGRLRHDQYSTYESGPFIVSGDNGDTTKQWDISTLQGESNLLDFADFADGNNSPYEFFSTQARYSAFLNNCIPVIPFNNISRFKMEYPAFLEVIPYGTGTGTFYYYYVNMRITMYPWRPWRAVTGQSYSTNPQHSGKCVISQTFREQDNNKSNTSWINNCPRTMEESFTIGLDYDSTDTDIYHNWVEFQSPEVIYVDSVHLSNASSKTITVGVHANNTNDRHSRLNCIHPTVRIYNSNPKITLIYKLFSGYIYPGSGAWSEQISSISISPNTYAEIAIQRKGIAYDTSYNGGYYIIASKILEKSI